MNFSSVEASPKKAFEFVSLNFLGEKMLEKAFNDFSCDENENSLKGFVT